MKYVPWLLPLSDEFFRGENLLFEGCSRESRQKSWRKYVESICGGFLRNEGNTQHPFQDVS